MSPPPDEVRKVPEPFSSSLGNSKSYRRSKPLNRGSAGAWKPQAWERAHLQLYSKFPVSSSWIKAGSGQSPVFRKPWEGFLAARKMKLQGFLKPAPPAPQALAGTEVRQVGSTTFSGAGITVHQHPSKSSVPVFPPCGVKHCLN